MTAISEEDIEEYLKNASLLDDDYMSIFFTDQNECMQVMLEIILEKKDIKVIKVETQIKLENIGKHSLCLDVLAKDSRDRVYNIEIQRDTRGAIPLRARYHASMLDCNLLDKGNNFRELSEVYVIFICEHDIFKRGLGLYKVDRRFEDNNELFCDKSHIIYMNTSYSGDDAIGYLSSDIRSADISNIHNKALLKRTLEIKELNKGGIRMSEGMQKLLNKYKDIWLKEAKEEGIQEGIERGIERGMERGLEHGKREGIFATAKNMLKASLDINLISQCTGLSLKQVQSLQE